EDADAELALALDGDDARVWQVMRRVDLELDALLEVDQVQVDLVGAVAQREVRDQGVHQRRFARAGAARDQDVLRGPLPQRQVLTLRGAGLAESHINPRAAVPGPPGVLGRRDELEGDFHPARIPSRGAGPVDDPRGEIRGRRWVELDRVTPEVGIARGQATV